MLDVLRQQKKKRPFLLRIEPFDIFMSTFEEQRALMLRFKQFYATLQGPVRIIAHSTRFNIQVETNRLRQQTARSTTPWEREGLDAYRRFLEDMAADLPGMKTTRYYMVCWLEGSGSEIAMLNAASSAFSVADNPVRAVTRLPPLFAGDMAAYPTYLAPVGPEGESPPRPYIALLHSRDMQGAVGFDVLARVLTQPFPLSVAIDVDTVPPDKVPRLLEMTYNRLVTQVGAVDSKDRGAETALQHVQFVMDATRSEGEGLHLIQIVVAVFADTLEELRTRVQTLKLSAGRSLQLRTGVGEQDTLTRFFTVAETPKFGAALRRTVLSSGAGVYTPIGIRQRERVDGILLGVGMDGVPVFDNVWARDGYNVVILGRIGSGKTFGTLEWLNREALQGTQIIYIDPQENCKRLTELCGGSYASLSVARGMQLNLLDLVHDEITAQAAHVTDLLQMLLNLDDRPAALKRVLTTEEAGAVEQALEALYAGLPPNPTAEDMPLLEHLTRYLLGGPAAQLARELEARFVHGPLGAVFNRPTNVPFDLRARVIAFSVKDVEKKIRPLVFTMLFGLITSKILRKDGQRRIIALDEFGILTLLDEIAGDVILRRATELAKRARHFDAGVWLIDQNLRTFEGAFGSQILDNAEHVTLYHISRTALEEVGARWPQLTEGHRNFLAVAQRGENVTILGNEVYTLFNLASSTEERAFTGT